MKLPNLTLVQKFSILSAISLTVVALLLGIVITQHFEQDALETTKSTAIESINKVILLFLKPEDFRKPKFDKEYSEFARKIYPLRIYPRLARIKVYNPEGTIIWSEERKLVGQTLGDNQGLKEALNGKIRIEISKLSGSEHLYEREHYNQLMKLYIPIKYAGMAKTAGVFVLYQNLDAFSIHISRLKREVWIITITGLTLLYLALFGIVKTASKTIVQQNIRLRRATEDLEDAYMDTIRTLAATIDTKDPYTAGHSERVVRYARLMAKKLGFTEKAMKNLIKGCFLHDVGKVLFPEQILHNKDPELTEETWEIVKQHPIAGANIVRIAPSLADLIPIIRHHQERFDGKGYPDGLKGEEIPLECRIIALVDAYDAMTTSRTYRKVLSKEEAIEEIKRNSGTQFDPKLVDIFIELLRSGFIDRRSHLERRLSALKSPDGIEHRSGVDGRKKGNQ